MNKGFSLIELLIVLAIVAILAAITYPGYRDHLTRARRIDGQTALLDLANRMERYYSETNTYQTATIASGKASDILSNSSSPDNWYTLSIINVSDSAYTLQATPTHTQATNDTRCQSLIFDSHGAKGITTGPSGTPTGPATQCW